MRGPLDLDAVEPHHTRTQTLNDDGFWDHCNECVEDWPCETMRLLALARAQAAEIARLRKVRSAAEYLLEHTHVDETGYTHVTGGACDVLATALPDLPE